MFRITSTAFAPDEPIPARFTCDGPGLSPPLAWTSVPEGARSLALIVDDPDAPDPAAPRRTWVHWLLYNLSPSVASLAEGAGNAPPADGAREGVNDSDELGYGGPCPPIGRHRYYFRLYALDTVLADLGDEARRRHLDAAMEGHVLGSAVLMGTYARPGSP